jgi:hypothetical protein
MTTEPNGGEEDRRTDNASDPSVEMWMAHAIDIALCHPEEDRDKHIRLVAEILSCAAQEIDDYLLSTNRQQAYWILRRLGNLLTAQPQFDLLNTWLMKQRIKERERTAAEDDEQPRRRLQDRASV